MWILTEGVAGTHFGAVLGDDFAGGCVLVLEEAGVSNGCFLMELKVGSNEMVLSCWQFCMHKTCQIKRCTANTNETQQSHNGNGNSNSKSSPNNQ